MKVRFPLWLAVILVLAPFLTSFVQNPAAKKGDVSSRLFIQTAGHPQFAVPGTSGFHRSADLSVVITDAEGRPVVDLGPSFIGNGSELITLPSEWTFEGNYNRPNQACSIVPNQFFNIGNGSYMIRVVSPCTPWVAGDYHYVIQVNRPAANGNPASQGSALGVVAIRTSY